MIATILAFAKAHWLVAVIAAAAGAAGSWFLHPKPQPAIEATSNSGYNGAETEVMAASATQGPIRIVTRTITKPGPGCTGPETDQTITEDRAPATAEIGAASEEHLAATESTTLKAKPLELPRFAIGTDLVDPFGDRKLHVQGGLRALGPFWGRLGWTPADGLLKGITVGAEVQW